LIGRVAADPANITIDQLAHFLYGRVSHTISRLTLSAGAQYQYGTFRGGAIQSQSEDYLMVDVSANYRFNEFLSAEVGYMAELLRDHGWQTTGVGVRNFDRNMVYIGIKATY
jgi:predicted porin